MMDSENSEFQLQKEGNNEQEWYQVTSVIIRKFLFSTPRGIDPNPNEDNKEPSITQIIFSQLQNRIVSYDVDPNSFQIQFGYGGLSGHIFGTNVTLGRAIDVTVNYDFEGISEQLLWLLKLSIYIIRDDSDKKIKKLIDRILEEIPSVIDEIEDSTYVEEGEAINRNTGAQHGNVPGSSVLQLGRASNGNNWGGGGPGGWPVFPKKIENDTAAFHFKFFPPAAKAQDFAELKEGEDVKIVILDTCPSEELWNTAVEKLVKDKEDQGKDPHPILKRLNDRLLGVKGAGFHMYRNRHPNPKDKYAVSFGELYSINQARTDLQLPSHSRVDHGIFIAGILDNIAPEAEIHLIQVMDDDGMLIFNTIEDALRDFMVYLDMENDHSAIIVNMSLNFRITEAERVDRVTKRDYEIDLLSLKRFRKSKNNIEALMIAAAGNEAQYQSRPNDEKPPYPVPPASFESVLGVSALRHDGERTQYTNWADDFDLDEEKESLLESDDDIKRQGIATFGGNAQPFMYFDADGEVSYASITHPEHGILGLFLSEKFETSLDGFLKVCAENKNGWARWCGTSFATAIVTGFAAKIASSMENPQTSAQSVITELVEYCDGRLQPSDPAKLEEHHLKVKQE